MTWSVAQIWRYPIKGIGAEKLERVTLTENRPLPYDRAYAVLQSGGETGDGWRACRNFLRGAKGPALMGVMARVDGTVIHLSHPARPDITIDPTRDGAALFDWLAPIYPADRPAPVALEPAPETGMADVPYASVSVLNHASRRALSQKLDHDLHPLRFRGNLWLDGLAPWEEFDLVGKTLSIGTAQLKVVEPITRCRATEANPETGHRDAATLSALSDGWGHQEFGIMAKVVTSGTIAPSDTVLEQ